MSFSKIFQNFHSMVNLGDTNLKHEKSRIHADGFFDFFKFLCGKTGQIDFAER